MPKKKQAVRRYSAKSSQDESFFDKIQTDLEKNNSFLNLVLGTLIVIVLGILIFNYFNKPEGSLGPSGQTDEQTADVKKEDLPGQYTIKEGDTLFLIAQNYYNDGYKYSKLVEANKLADENKIEVGQVLDIPKLEEAKTPTNGQGTGGAINQTIWGEKITGDTYTVVKGDWLSTIAGRAYGDIYMYEKIAKANNLSNADAIEVGTTLKIPR
ncbi:LysM peptidoglycan-binding domain-containing protein [Candidatus Daviesbacteria bacterium]|nr:LysM peptidoglycan-binding domain-containing protein [Candidatus Daviesbacteria bacterium]